LGKRIKRLKNFSIMAELPRVISASINLAQIDKAHIVEGKKGKYVNIALLISPNDQFGNDFMVVQSLPKELREKGQKGPILGNAKAWTGEGSKSQEAGPDVSREPKKAAPQATENGEDDLPF
jgi:hypothetical protein